LVKKTEEKQKNDRKTHKNSGELTEKHCTQSET